jgi:hypothetical protein
MSFSITFFGPRHYFWDLRGQRDERMPRAWFYRPDEHSTGGVGFCIPGLHVCFMWGRK